jgi:predicted MPP superfamily phosphohydrolase
MFCDLLGYTDTLEILLRKLGYVRKSGAYQRPDKRQVAFVGDFIDRGPKIRETLHILRNMIDSGNAIAVMGNHEFNAISFHTPHVEKGGFFRDHRYKEIRQHLGTLEQFKYFDHEWADFLEWFKTLTLFFENDDFRLVHACWENQQFAFLREHFKGVTPTFLSESNDKQTGSELYHAVND